MFVVLYVQEDFYNQFDFLLKILCLKKNQCLSAKGMFIVAVTPPLNLT